MSDAPLPKPFPLQAGHPANHRYVQCARCGTWRPCAHAFHSAEASAAYLKWLESGEGDAPDLGPAHCGDVAWCSEQAKATGRLEGP